jgi:predicted acylesterase/phospholipase RssA
VTGSSALVLGGGGVTGVAWELGILAGLADAGVDLSAADAVVGTSAGAVVGALVATGTPIGELYDAQLEVAMGEVPGERAREPAQKAPTDAAVDPPAESVPEMGWKVGLRLAGHLLMPGGSRFR